MKSEDQKLLNEISVDYTITKATFTNKMKIDSVVMNAGSISFSRCKVGSGGCDGYYELVGYPKANFRYFAEQFSYAIMINVPTPELNPEENLKFTIYSDFNIIEKTGNTLLLYEGNA